MAKKQMIHSGQLLSNRFRLGSSLGEGGMGVVYRAHDTLLKRDVAIKVLSSTGLGAEGRDRLLREAQATCRLSHPNIVTVFDVGDADGSPYIVMELVEGETLDNQRPQNLNETVALVKQLCAALDHAHTNGIIHRDLKPENIMMVDERTAKLMDFGLAHSAAARVTQEGVVMGTLHYMAPEMIQGAEIDHRVDLYALGVILYELATGQLPFDAEDPVSILSQHLYAPVVPPQAQNAEIPPTLDYLIVRLLAKEPGGRPSSAADVLQTLEQMEVREGLAEPARELSVLDRIVRGRLVGREEEFDQARTIWARAVAGEGQVLLISGEPGIGKTRLMQELITQATITGGKALVGACYEEGASPYAPFRQILQEELGQSGGKDYNLPAGVLADLITLAPELRLNFPELTAETELDPQTARQRLMDSMVVFFMMLSNQAPMLLVLEDTHWADGGTLSLLRHLARNSRRSRLMIVATYREVELEDARAFHELMLDFSRERLATRIKLGRLDRGKTEALLATLFAEEITPEFLEGIYRETEGNPFFIEEVCKALVESGKLYFQGGRWHRPSVEELGIPQSIQVAIYSRVRGLSEGVQEVLEQAAVLGREFDFDTLSRASDLPEEKLIYALEEAERAQLIEESGPERGGRFTFIHALIPTTLALGLRTLRRRRLHSRAATALETTRPDGYEVLARHFIEAGKTEKGVAYLMQAGDRARSLYAHEEAIDSYRQILDYLEEKEELELAARTTMKLALTYHSSFAYAQSRQAYEAGFALWQQAGRREPAESLPPAPRPLRLARREPLTLDPGRSGEVDSSSVIEQLFSGLVELTPGLNVVPDVAMRWQVLDGGRRYIFHLCDGVAWSDGSPVSAVDFEFAWKRVLDPANDTTVAQLLYDIKGARAYHRGQLTDPDQIGVKASDSLTLVVELEEPTSYFLQLLTHDSTFPVPKKAVLAQGAAWTEVDKIITNGPYRLQAYRPGELVVLKRNPAYHRPFSGNVETVELRLFDSPSAEILDEYDTDRLDNFYLSYLSDAEAERALFRHAGDSISGPAAGVSYLAFNTNQSPFDDRRVRQALAMAIDKEALVSASGRHYWNPAGGGLVPPGMPGHSPGIALPYDPELGCRLLAEAGYPLERDFPVLEVMVSTIRVPIVEHLSLEWREKLGLELTWTVLGWEARRKSVLAGAGALFLLGWTADYPDPDTYLRAADWPYATRWKNEAYEQLVESARQTSDQAERIGLYQQADKMLIEEAVVVPLQYGRYHMLVKPWLKKFPTSPVKGTFWKDVVMDPDQTPH